MNKCGFDVFPFSWDVKEMFTNIPHEAARKAMHFLLNNCAMRFKTSHTCVNPKTKHVPTKVSKKLFQWLCLLWCLEILNENFELSKSGTFPDFASARN